MKNIYWNFVIGTVLLIVNAIVGLADFLQGGAAVAAAGCDLRVAGVGVGNGVD